MVSDFTQQSLRKDVKVCSDYIDTSESIKAAAPSLHFEVLIDRIKIVTQLQSQLVDFSAINLEHLLDPNGDKAHERFVTRLPHSRDQVDEIPMSCMEASRQIFKSANFTTVSRQCLIGSLPSSCRSFTSRPCVFKLPHGSCMFVSFGFIWGIITAIV